MLTVGSRLVATAIDLDYLGQGVVKHEGYVIFVPRFLTGETAEIQIINVKDNYAEGKIERLINESKLRTHHVDAVYGGADLLHLNTEAQCSWQAKITQETLKKIGGIETSIEPTLTDGNPYHYRNKSVFHVMDSPMLKLGLYAHDNSKLIQARTYVLADEPTNRILSYLYDHPTIIDNKSFSHLVIRTNPSGKALVTFVATKPLFKGQHALVENLKTLDFIVGITLNIKDHPRHIMGKHSVTLMGENLITEPLGAIEVKLNDRSFFQVNLPVSMHVYALIKSKMTHNSVVIDAYSGIGSIGFYIADISKKVIMIESNFESVDMANRIKEEYTFHHVDVICDRAETVMQHLTSDIIITDPPRNGLMPEMIDQILKGSAKQMFYLSCDLKTLSRDLKRLITCYEIDKVIPIRMFPQTTEMETLVILKRRSPDACS